MYFHSIHTIPLSFDIASLATQLLSSVCIFADETRASATHRLALIPLNCEGALMRPHVSQSMSSHSCSCNGARPCESFYTLPLLLMLFDKFNQCIERRW